VYKETVHDSRDFKVMSGGNPVPVKPAKPPKSKIKVIKEPKPKNPAKKPTKRKVKP
jgi:hypothetical protein